MNGGSMSRRGFMQTGAVAGSGALLMASEPARKQAWRHKSIAGKVRFGVIGVGQRARAHLPWMARFPGECEVAAFCDIDQGQIDKSLKLVPAKPKIYYDWREMIQDSALNAVLIATPHYLHHDMILGCLERGLHILVEKPMVMDPIEAGRVVRKWRYSGVTLLVTVQHMYSPRIQATKKLIDEGELGEVKFIYWPMFRGDWAVKGEDLRQEHELNWMYMKTLQGDVLVADSVHYFTQSNYLLGVKPVRAAALGGVIDYHDGRNTMDHCCAVVEYEGGAKLSHNMLLFARNYAEEGVRIIGDKASLSFQRENLIIGPRSPSKPERAAPIPKTIYSPSGDDGMPDMYQDFFRCARSGRLPLCNALSGANGVLVAYACQQSAYRKEVIEIADLDPVTPG